MRPALLLVAALLLGGCGDGDTIPGEHRFCCDNGETSCCPKEEGDDDASDTGTAAD